MTKEELEKEAQRSFDELDDWCVGDDWSIEESYKNGFSNGAEPREKRIAELEAQIEKMKKELHHRLVSPSHDDSDCLDKIIGLDRLWQFGQEF